MVSPTAEEMRKMMGEKGKDIPDSFKGEMASTWAMDGRYIKSEGWHEFGGGAKSSMIEYITYDSKAKKFRTWYFSDYGERGESTMTPSDDGKSFKFKGTGVDMMGNSVSMTGSMRFVDNDTIEWDWAEYQGLMQTMKIKGTSKRQG